MSKKFQTDKVTRRQQSQKTTLWIPTPNNRKLCEKFPLFVAGNNYELRDSPRAPTAKGLKVNWRMKWLELMLSGSSMSLNSRHHLVCCKHFCSTQLQPGHINWIEGSISKLLKLMGKNFECTALNVTSAQHWMWHSKLKWKIMLGQFLTWW